MYRTTAQRYIAIYAGTLTPVAAHVISKLKRERETQDLAVKLIVCAQIGRAHV